MEQWEDQQLQPSPAICMACLSGYAMHPLLPEGLAVPASTSPNVISQPQSLKEVFTAITLGPREGNSSPKAVQKLLIKAVGGRNMLKKTRQMLLQPPMFKISRDFIVSLEGLHVMEHHLENGQHTTAFSIVDHYMGRPDTTQVLYQHQMEDIIFGYLTCASVLVLHFYHLATFHSALKVTCIVLSCSFKALRMIVETQS